MKKFLLHTLVVIGLAFCLANLIAAGSLWALRNSSFYKPSFLANAITEDNFDYIILGASTGLTTLDTKAIDSQAGSNGLNLAMDDTGIASATLMLEHFLAEGKNTKYVVLAPSLDSYNTKEVSLSDNDYRFLMYANRDYVGMYYDSVAAPNTMSKTLAASQVFPVLGVSYFNAEIFYPSLVSMVKPDRRNRFDDRGNYTYPVGQKQQQSEPKKPYELLFDSPQLAALYELCMQHQIKLIYYISPVQHKKVEFKPGDVTIIDHSDVIKDDTQFYDKIHVNSLGRTTTSRIFADTLKNMLSVNPLDTVSNE